MSIGLVIGVFAAVVAVTICCAGAVLLHTVHRALHDAVSETDDEWGHVEADRREVRGWVPA